MCLQRALGTSAQSHKRALRLERACNAKAGFIAHQQAALESKDHATSDMQSTIARLTQSATEQERIIAEQQAAIAALQVHTTKLVCHEHSHKHHQQSSQVCILTTEHPSQCLTSPISCCHVRISSCTLTRLGFDNLAWVRHEHNQPIACNTTCSRGTHCLPTHLSSVVHCLHSAPIAPLRTRSFNVCARLHLSVQATWTACMHANASTLAMSGLTMTKQLQVASYYCDVCVCKDMEHLLHVTQHACHPSKHCTNGHKLFLAFRAQRDACHG